MPERDLNFFSKAKKRAPKSGVKREQPWKLGLACACFLLLAGLSSYIVPS